MKGLLLLANDCEDLEAIGTKALLERAELEVLTATFNSDKKVSCYYGTVVEADLDANEIEVDDFDFLVVPGGMYVSREIKEDKIIKPLIKRFANKNKLVAAICAAPMFLGDLGLLKNKNYTIFPGCESESYRGNLKQQFKAVTDGNIVTGRSVGGVFEYSYEIVKYLKGIENAEALLTKAIY